MKTYDDRLVEWVVMAGDPGKSAVSYLSGLGFDVIVIPREVYLFGGVERPVPPVPPPDDPELAFKLRLRDCMQALAERTP